MAAGTLIAEYVRQSRNSAKAAEQLEARWQSAESRITQLEQLATEYSKEIDELNKKVYPSKAATKAIASKSTSNDGSKSSSVEAGAISKAIEEATGKLTRK